VTEIFPSKEPVREKVSVLGRRDFAQTQSRWEFYWPPGNSAKLQEGRNNKENVTNLSAVKTEEVTGQSDRNFSQKRA
jgi:hypothetical protein